MLVLHLNLKQPIKNGMLLTPSGIKAQVWVAGRLHSNFLPVLDTENSYINMYRVGVLFL